jgi:hypothetical protein
VAKEGLASAATLCHPVYRAVLTLVINASVEHFRLAFFHSLGFFSKKLELMQTPFLTVWQGAAEQTWAKLN